MKCLKTTGVLTILLMLCGCVPLIAPPVPTPRPDRPLPIVGKSYLDQGKRYFETGYYKRALRELLPLACDGVPDAQYAVGYMYYYGYGVAQDTFVGFFWIERAARKGFIPAVKAVKILAKKENWPPPPADIKRYDR